MRILVIDDEPQRTRGLVKAKHFVAVAHTMEQIQFWLRNGPWDQIILDHDLCCKYDGFDLCKEYGTEYISFGCPIRIWSCNPVGAKKMLFHLEDIAKELDIDVKIDAYPFGSSEDDIWG